AAKKSAAKKPAAKKPAAKKTTASKTSARKSGSSRSSGKSRGKKERRCYRRALAAHIGGRGGAAMPAAPAHPDLGEEMERLSQGQIIAAVAAVVLLVATFLPWVGAAGHNENLWKGTTLDEYLLITAIVAALPAVLAFAGAAEEFSFLSAATF